MFLTFFSKLYYIPFFTLYVSLHSLLFCSKIMRFPPLTFFDHSSICLWHPAVQNSGQTLDNCVILNNSLRRNIFANKIHFFKTSKRICSIEPLWSKPFQLSVLAIKKMQQKNMNLKIHRSAFILQPIFKRLYQDAEHFQIDLFCQEKTFHVLDFSIFESSQLQFNKIFPTWVTQFT